MRSTLLSFLILILLCGIFPTATPERSPTGRTVRRPLAAAARLATQSFTETPAIRAPVKLQDPFGALSKPHVPKQDDKGRPSVAPLVAAAYAAAGMKITLTERIQEPIAEVDGEVEEVRDLMQQPMPLTVNDALKGIVFTRDTPLADKSYLDNLKYVVAIDTRFLGTTYDEREFLLAIHCYAVGMYQMSRAINGGNKHEFKPFLPYLRLLVEAVRTLSPKPTEGQQLYRGMGIKRGRKFTKGEQMTWWSMTSCTSDRQIAEEFASDAEDGQKPMVFVITTDNAYDISHISLLDEKESLLMPGTVFEVTKVAGREIHLRDVGNEVVDLRRESAVDSEEIEAQPTDASHVE